MKYTLSVVMILLFATLACNLSSGNDPQPTPLVFNPLPVSNTDNDFPQEGSGDNAPDTDGNTTNDTNTDNSSSGSSGSNTGSNNTNTGSNTGSNSGTTTCTPRTDWTIFYSVQPGDTLGDLAKRTGSTTTALAQGNCLDNANVLSVGQNLRVPRQPNPPPFTPTIGSLRFTPTVSENGTSITVPSGQRITISTTASSANSVSFYMLLETGTPQLIGTDSNLADGASIGWDSPRDGLGTLTIFAEAVNAAGQRVASAFYAVSWGPSCPYGWFFGFNADSINHTCPLPVFSGATTAQDFEGGRAFDYPIASYDGLSYIFVLYNDGSYEYFVDEYNSNIPLDNSDLTVPTNRYAPNGSIGYLWKNNEGVRNRLGWAYSPVESFTGRWQFAEGDAESTRFPPIFPGWSVYIDYGKNGLVLNLTEMSAGNSGRRWKTVGRY